MDRCRLGVVQDRRFKYVHFAALPPLLFDLEEDPKQLRNLADNSGYKPIMLVYAQKMLSWRMEDMERTLTGMAARGSWCALEAQRWTMRGARGRTEDGQ